MSDYVCKLRTRLSKARDLAHANLRSAQAKMKALYDTNTRERVFEIGDNVLVLSPRMDNPLAVRYHGPYEIVKKIGDVDYVLKTPGRRKATQLCHVNRLKPYYHREQPENVLVVENTNSEFCEQLQQDEEMPIRGDYQMKLKNSDILSNIEAKLSHLSSEKGRELAGILHKYECIFPDVPQMCSAAVHDVDVEEAGPVKQHPYRVGPAKTEKLQAEISYMLENKIVEPSKSNWASPCVLVPKSDGSVRFCTDFRKVNALTKTDSYPIPRIDDCIDRIGNAAYITKCDLLKGYWCVPLSPRAKEISAFVTPTGLYQYNVMPFGMKNSQATFQRMMHNVLRDLKGVDVYVDDIVVYNNTWEEHVSTLYALFDRLTEAKLTVNLGKSDFGQAKVVYLGHVVGQGEVSPIAAKIKGIVQFPVPNNKKSLMRFLGMAGYYRKFCKNFSGVTAPLTDLLKKKREYEWTMSCQVAFDKI